MPKIEHPQNVGDILRYNGKVVATVTAVRTEGANRRLTLSTGYDIVVPSR